MFRNNEGMPIAAFALLLFAAGREVAITIDDLPRGGDRRAPAADTLRMTRKLLEPFRAGRLPVTGFVNECRGGPELRELLTVWRDAGAELGNHTCSHPDLNTAPLAHYLADITPRGDRITSEIIGRPPRYFRHPFLHAGKDDATRTAVNAFLADHGYRVAPVTLDNSDYLFAALYGRALDRGDTSLGRRVLDAYLPYMESIFEFFEKRSEKVTGHEIRQILLIHANQLNADAMPALLAMMSRRGYRIVTLERALEDPAYRLADDYSGTGGFSWIHRWSRTKGMKPESEPDEPAWVQEELRKLSGGEGQR